MKALNTKKADEIFSAVVVIVLLLILPLWGAMAMMVGSAIGLVAFLVWFRGRISFRFGLLLALIAFAVAAGIALMLLFGRGHHWG